MENPNYYAIIPASVRYNKNLKPNEKLLYGEISALANKNGYCTAQNTYFANLYNVNKKTVSNWISKLEKIGYIKIKILYKEKVFLERRIYLSENTEEIDKKQQKDEYPIHENMDTYPQKDEYPIHKKMEQNNTSNNNTSIIYGQFEIFYKKYPKKVKKQDVKKWFEKNKPSDKLFSSMMSSLEQFIKSSDWQKDKGQFIPYPTTWLNQKRWEDETIITQENRKCKEQEIVYNTDFSEYDEYAKKRNEKSG